MHRRTLLALLATLPFASFARAAAKPFDPAAFAAAQKSGKPVLVVAYAEWCPTCRKQEPAIESLLKTPEFANFQWFKVDFDLEEEVLKSFRVTKQSTLIVFRGDKEVARSTGQTRTEAIAELLRKAL